jgi:hypothetical protein
VFFVRRVFQFINDFSYELKGDVELCVKFIDYIMRNFNKKVLINCASDLLERVIQEIGQPVPIEYFQKISQFVLDNLGNVSNVMALESFIGCMFKLSNYYQTSEEISTSLSGSLSVVEVKYAQYYEQRAQWRENKNVLIGMLQLLEVTIKNLNSKTNVQIYQTFVQKFLERFYGELNSAFEEFHDISGIQKPFNSVYRSIINACPIEIYNYAPQMLDTLFTIMRKNPIKYSDSLGLCEGLIATNSDNDFIKIWVRDH